MEERKGLSKEDKSAIPGQFDGPDQRVEGEGERRGLSREEKEERARNPEAGKVDKKRKGTPLEEKRRFTERKYLTLRNAIDGSVIQVPKSVVDYVEKRGIDDALIFIKPTAMLAKYTTELAGYLREEGATGAQAPGFPPAGWLSAEEVRKAGAVPASDAEGAAGTNSGLYNPG